LQEIELLKYFWLHSLALLEWVKGYIVCGCVWLFSLIFNVFFFPDFLVSCCVESTNVIFSLVIYVYVYESSTFSLLYAEESCLSFDILVSSVDKKIQLVFSLVFCLMITLWWHFYMFKPVWPWVQIQVHLKKMYMFMLSFYINTAQLLNSHFLKNCHSLCMNLRSAVRGDQGSAVDWGSHSFLKKTLVQMDCLGNQNHLIHFTHCCWRKCFSWLKWLGIVLQLEEYNRYSDTQTN
jgi:hypothetical protein